MHWAHHHPEQQLRACAGAPRYSGLCPQKKAEAYVDLIILTSRGLECLLLLSHHQIEKNNYSTPPMVYF